MGVWIFCGTNLRVVTKRPGALPSTSGDPLSLMQTPEFTAPAARRSKSALTALVVLALCGAGLALRAARQTPQVEFTPAPPSYEEALRAAEASDAAKKQAPKAPEPKTKEGKETDKPIWG
jgi:hypothetical protein